MSTQKSGGRLRVWLAFIAFGATTAATAQQSQEPSPTKDNEEVVRLSPFTVSATAEVGYGSLMNTSGRLAKPYQDVPQMANVVTSEFLQDMMRFDTLGALTFVPGVTPQFNTVQIISMRGLATTSRFIDGFQAPVFSSGIFSFGNGAINDVAFFDRIEVIKGPAPGSFGRGDPAGFINFVTKDPTFRRSTEVDVMLGTGNSETFSQRYMIDTNGLLTEDGKTAYRVVAVSSKGAESPDFTEYEDNSVLLALKRNFAGRGSLSLKTTFSRDRIPGFVAPIHLTNQYKLDALMDNYGDLGSYANVVRFKALDGNSWLAYNVNKIVSQTFSTTATFEYRLSEHWSTREAAKFLQGNTDGDSHYGYSYAYAADGVTPMAGSFRFLQTASIHSSAFQSDFVGNYKIPAIESAFEILAGGDFGVTKYREAEDSSLIPKQPIHAWNPDIPLPGWSINPEQKYYRERRNDSSVYGQLEVRLWQERLRLTGSWRRNFTDLNGYNTISGVSTIAKTDSPLLPAYSVLFKLNQGLSIYALRSKYSVPPVTVPVWFLLPTSDPRSQERTVSQARTELKELGLKGNLFSGRFGFSICVYDLTQGGSALYAQIADPAATNGIGLAQKVVSTSSSGTKGIEFESFGKITDKLTFLLNAYYVISSHTLYFVTPAGKESFVTNYPIAGNPNTVAGYATYNFAGNGRHGLSLTAGFKTIFSGWRMNSTFVRPAKYPETNTIVDLGISYGFSKHWELYLKGNNVFSRIPFPTADVGVAYGRKILGGVTARF